jgi:CubicO group peptidase (beta-lactamase class C family)
MKRWVWILAFVCACAFFSLGGIAQSTGEAALKARLDQVANSYTTGNAFMGTVLVADGDQILLNKGYGFADLEWSIPNIPDTKFRLGSLTKQFTAALILLLQQDGKLKIGDPVNKYLPDAPKTWDKITLADLLGHTSGIPNLTALKGFHEWSMNAHTHDEELAFFSGQPLDFEPGSKFAYSNSNYLVLGAVIEKITGMKYSDLLHERLLDPLGMTDSGRDSDELILPKRAQGYRPSKNGLIVARSESMTVPWSAGSIYSTTGDLLKWEHGLFGGKVLSADSLKAMTTPGKGNYGLGVAVTQRDGLTIVDHGGGIEGFNTYLEYVPERKIAVIVLANVNGSAPESMARQLLDVALGKKVILASERKAVPIDKGDLAKFAGVYDLAPTFSITIAVAGDGLTAQGTGQPALPLMYEGAQDGHPKFFSTQVDAEIEFIPDQGGAITSMILHQGGMDQTAKRH